MEVNNFKKLMEEEEERYLRMQDDRHVRAGVWGTLGFFRLVGDLITMFIPRVMDVFVMAAGGRHHGAPGIPQSSAPPSQGPAIDPGKIAPSLPEGDDGDDGLR